MPFYDDEARDRFRRGEEVEVTESEFTLADLARRGDFFHGDIVHLCQEPDKHIRRKVYGRKRLIPQLGASFMLTIEWIRGEKRAGWVYLDRGDAERPLATDDNVEQLVLVRNLLTTRLDQPIKRGATFRFYYRKDPNDLNVTNGIVSPIRTIILSPAMTYFEKESYLDAMNDDRRRAIAMEAVRARKPGRAG